MAFQTYLRRHGAPVDRYLRRNGLPTLCEDPDVFVPVKRVWSFFDEESRSEDPLLGWHVGEFVGDHSLNASLLQKLEHAPTLFGAIQRLTALVRTEGTDIDIGIFERRSDILFYTHYWGRREVPGYHVAQAYQLSVFFDLIRFFLGRNWTPDEMGLEAAEVPSELQRRLPNTRILVRRPLGYIAIPRKLLYHAARQSVPDADEARSPVANQYFNYLQQLREVIKAYLSEGYVSECTAAGLMDTSVRSLTRALAGHGLTYGKLVDDVRFELAKKRLNNSDARIIDVANSVGFGDQANFTRMFRRISGITPGQFRRLLRSEGSELGPP